VKKSRFFYLHPKVNSGKIASLEALQAEYTSYLEICVSTMLQARRFSLSKGERQAFFPRYSALSSQIVKNVRAHAVAIVSGWAASKYTVKLRSVIRAKFKGGEFDEATRSALCILGKRLIDAPSGKVTQEALNLYWSWLLDEGVVGKSPRISDRTGMRLSEMTSIFGKSESTRLAAWWIGFSHLDAGKSRIQLPLVANPYVKEASDVAKGVLARKTRQGRWRFEVVERKKWEVIELPESAPRLGVDVGLNVMAATSDGRLLEAGLKSKFNALYYTVRDVRANRQRQGLMDDSPRLNALESRLTGLVKTLAGTCANKLIAAYPRHVFVVEDLDLRGCRGQKRFAYRALHHSLEAKASTEVVNPAYTSQTCPNCGFVARKNRNGTRFQCCYCGKISHADVVGGSGLLRRSEDKQIGLDDYPAVVKPILEARHEEWKKFQVSLSALGRKKKALEPSSQELTTEVPSFFRNRHSFELEPVGRSR